MKNVTRKVTLALGALAFAGAAAAQDPRPMVEWVVPAAPTNKPQSPEQAKAGVERGRELPPPEIRSCSRSSSNITRACRSPSRRPMREAWGRSSW